MREMSAAWPWQSFSTSSRTRAQMPAASNELVYELHASAKTAGVKVFSLTIDEIEQHIDELMPPVAALGSQAASCPAGQSRI